jgi:hypothetical protein
MAEVEPGGRLDLAYGVTVVSSGVTGRTGEVVQGTDSGQPVRDAEPGTLPELLALEGLPEQGARILGTVAESVGMRRELSIPLEDLASVSEPTGGTRGGNDAPYLDITVAAPFDDEGQVLLEVDDVGLVRWHVSTVAAEQTSSADRADAVQTFRVPVAQVEIGTSADRGPLAFGVRKVLHLLRFPVERAAARVATLGVGWWEGRHRGYGLRRATPEYFARATEEAAGGGVEIGSDWLVANADEPILLLVHGTFSVGHSAFAGLAADHELRQRFDREYGGRVLLFDHPSVHVDPVANVGWLLDRLPTDRAATFDVIAHSRGGLVARQLASPALAAAAGRPAPVVRRVVHVATPNSGTVLASKDRLGDLLDVFTNLVTLFFEETTGAVLAGVLEVVKQVAVGVHGGLEGLAAMDPATEALQRLNGQIAGDQVFAIASNFQPAGASLPIRALDTLTDAMFGEPNDLVVPTEGVYNAGAYTVTRQYNASGCQPPVSHSGYFADPDVRRQLDQWLLRA